MTKAIYCSQCGDPIPEDAPGGECPKCLMKAGLDPVSDEEDPAYTIEELDEAFPHLEIVEQIGQGGMGVIYRARQRTLDREVALKILPRKVSQDPAFAERFNREAKALARLSHPNIVYIHEAGQAGGIYYLVMELVDGVNLRQAIKDRHLTPAEALQVVPQICSALQYAHDQGVVHRDIKPENILIDRKGAVKIADFGLAKMLRPRPDDLSLTSVDQVMGTYHYMAPEQIRTPKDVDHRADIYSLGVVFYEMLTGELPIGHFPPPSKKVEVDVRLDSVVLRALEQERERRYQRAEEIKTDVGNIGSSEVRPPRKSKPRGTKLSALALTGILFIPGAAILELIVLATETTNDFLHCLAPMALVVGIIISRVAWSAIKARPKRLHGLGMAKTGVYLPAVILSLLAVGLTVLYFVNRSFIKTEYERARKQNETAELHKQASRLLDDLIKLRTNAKDGEPVLEELLPFFDPKSRQKLLGYGKQERADMASRDELGFPFVLDNSLAASLSYYSIKDAEYTSFRSEKQWVRVEGGQVVIVCNEEEFRVPMILSERKWYFELGKVERGSSVNFETPPQVDNRKLIHGQGTR